MKINPTYLVCVIMLSLALPIASHAADYAVVDVTVIPMDREIAIPHQTVLVSAGRIVTLGPADDVQLPESSTAIDGGGRYLMPGLADMHTHPGHESDLLLYPIHGVTTIRINADFGENLEWRRATRESESRYPNMIVAGPIIDVDPPWFEGSVTLATPEEARVEVERQVAAGYDFIKIFPRFSRETYRTLIETAHEHRRLVTGHALYHLALTDVLDTGIDAIEHMDGYSYALQQPPLGAADDWPEDPGSGRTQQKFWLTASSDRFQPVSAALARSGTWTVPTLTVALAYSKTQSEVDEFLGSGLARITHPEDLSFWSRFAFDQGTSEEAKLALGVMLAFVRSLHDAGAGILAGTDSANPFVVHGAAIHDELGYFAEAGLTPYEAIRTSTVEAARFLRQQGEFGRIAAGLRADLLLLNANPLEDIRHLRNIAGVMLRGNWMPAEELAAMRATIEDNLAELSSSVQ